MMVDQYENQLFQGSLNDMENPLRKTNIQEELKLKKIRND